MSELLSSMGYFSGINELVDPMLLGYNTKDIPGIGQKAIRPLTIGENIYIDNVYHINSRPGHTVLSAIATYNIWSNKAGTIGLFTRGSDLYSLNSDYTGTIILSGISSDTPMSYWEWNDRIYFSNGVNIGYLKAGTCYPLLVPSVINPDKLTGGIAASIPMPYKVVMPAGQHIAVYRGHLLSARDNVLYVSDAFSDCYDMRGSILGTGRAYVPFNSAITMVRPVDDGIYIADGKTWFLAGKEFESMEKQLVDNSPVVPFTDINIEGELLDKPGGGEYAMWISGAGIMQGSPKGEVVNITDAVIDMPENLTGAVIIRDENGIVQYVSTIRR